MDDQQMEIIRRRLERGEERQREHRQELRRDFQRHGELVDAIAAARKVCPWGMIPVCLLTVRFAYLAGFWSIPFLFMGLLGMIVVGYFAPGTCAFAVNFWFYNSGVSTRRATIVVLLLAETAFTGWMFLFYGRMLDSLL
jgi:hypothetical protein